MRLHLIFFLLFTSSFLTGNEVVVRSPEGELIVLQIQSDDTFLGVVELMNSSVGGCGEYLLDFMSFSPKKLAKKEASPPFKDYSSKVTSSQKKDIKFIVNTLGMNSLVSISSLKSDLKKTGKRIESIHPLRFLGCVFTDEEMKASMQAMEGRSWVWSEFASGLINSLEVEASRDNLKWEFIIDFSTKVGVSTELLGPIIQKRQWDSFISTLIHNVPRSGNAGRYTGM